MFHVSGGTAEQTARQRITGRSRAIRFAEVIALTVLWIALGLTLHLDQRVYVAIGIPLVLGFQLLVRRRPIRDLWVRDGDPFVLDHRDRAVATVLVAYPLIAMVLTAGQGEWLNALMALCCTPGAFAAAYAFRRLSAHGRVMPAARAAALATVIGLGIMVYAIVPQMSADSSVLTLIGRGLHSLLLYIPVGFVMEEVSFRGCVDAHVHEPGERFGWLSAILVSVLWALWHVPIDIGTQPFGDLIVTLLIIHVSIGVPLSIAWRRSGNLTLPVAAHAVIDSVRDGLLAGV